MATKVGNKLTLSISLNKDAHQYLLEQASDAHLNASNYIERLILEKNFEKNFEKKISKEQA